MLVVGAALLTGSRWVDLALVPLVLVQSVSWVAAPAALLGLGGAAVATARGGGGLVGRVGLVAACALLVSVHTAIWAPWLVEETPRRGQALTVMAVNLYVGRADVDALAQLVRDRGVDLLALSEVTPGSRTAMRRAGLDDLLPHAVGATSGPAGGTLLRSRTPLTPAPNAGDLGAGPGPVRHPVAEVDVGGGLLLVRGVHLDPPVRGRIAQWRSGLDALAGWATARQRPLVVLGDFNASVDHPGLRQVLDAGLRDAHELAGSGRPPTWPRGRLVPEFVHIDHVLVRGVDVASAVELPIPGSDHDVVVAELVLP